MVDLHNHTYLCNHATGTMEEYIQKAISQNIKIFGFSDHNPMKFDEKYRMKFEDIQTYKNEVFRLKEKYKNQIEILYAYEVDFMPEYIEKRLLDENVDYLIGSVHFLDNWGFDNPEFISVWNKRDVNDVYEEYFEKIIELAESKLFDIVGHFDLIKVFGHKPTKNIKQIDLALEAIKDNNLVIEINSAGIRKKVNEPYPSIDILKKIKDLDIDITFSSDAHSIEQVGMNLKKMYNLAKKIGFKKAVYFKNKQKFYKEI